MIPQFQLIYQHLSNIITHNVKLQPENRVLLIYDQDSELGRCLAQTYTKVIESYSHQVILFDPAKAEELKDTLFALQPRDCVILVQTTNFRLSEFRIRMELNARGIIVIDHNHLDLITAEQIPSYLQALTYDYDRYKKICDHSTPLLQKAQTVTIVSKDGSQMNYISPLDKIYYNIGELHETLGSFYPIGEFFSEPCDLTKVNGTFLVYAYPSVNHDTIIANQPFHVQVQNGSIISHDGPDRFEQIMQLVREENNDNRVPIREMGFGLNRCIGKHAVLGYVGAHERQCGFHVSIGLKHGIYRKKIPHELNQRYHIDMFIDVEKIVVDDIVIFENGDYKSA